MENLRERLVECFSVVFPAITSDQAIHATPDTISDWDSTHHILLRSVIEEAFHIEIPDEVLAGFESFGDVEQYLSQATEGA